MRLLVLPRDPNPYQNLLYREMEHLGVEITYIGELTPSRTLNILLLPLELAARRIGGARLIHLHWVFAFALPGSARLPVIRYVAYVWFRTWLLACRILGVHLVWTAHNVLPHEPVFANDVLARRDLAEASDLVLIHSPEALAGLTALGAVPRRAAVVQHGPFHPRLAMESLRVPGADDRPRQFLFLGSVREYKGVDSLLTAFSAMPSDIAAHLTIVGQCRDPKLRSSLETLARKSGSRVTLHLERVPDESITSLLAAADVVVLPFRSVTTSGSAMLALSHGRPLIVPDLSGFADLPELAVLRYKGGTSELTTALISMAHADGARLAAMSDAARSYSSRTTWRDIAERTTSEMSSLLSGTPQPDACSEPVRAS
jgi:glycosyltransferase involved in cell wall biosynthesis